jgi:hypothetical protein
MRAKASHRGTRENVKIARFYAKLGPIMGTIGEKQAKTGFLQFLGVY